MVEELNDFYEDDEPAEKIRAAFEAGRGGRTGAERYFKERRENADYEIQYRAAKDASQMKKTPNMMTPGDKAWLVLLVYIAGYDLWAMKTGSETLSQSYSRALRDHRRWPTLVLWSYLTAHLTSSIPERPATEDVPQMDMNDWAYDRGTA